MAATNSAPRERLMKAADLFYKEGIRAIGINRVLEESRTPIMTLYRHFGSKEGLVAAYLERRDERIREKFATEMDRRAASPREKILVVFDILREVLEDPEYLRGCAFINASVEMASPDHEISQIAIRHKDASRQGFAELAAEAGVPDPSGLAIQLQLLMDGAFVDADMRRDPSSAAYARSAAETLLDAALAAGRTGGVRRAQPRKARR
jgi:AcrR family transcriptional regulator